MTSGEIELKEALSWANTMQVAIEDMARSYHSKAAVARFFKNKASEDENSVKGAEASREVIFLGLCIGALEDKIENLKKGKAP